MFTESDSRWDEAKVIETDNSRFKTYTCKLRIPEDSDTPDNTIPSFELFGLIVNRSGNIHLEIPLSGGELNNKIKKTVDHNNDLDNPLSSANGCINKVRLLGLSWGLDRESGIHCSSVEEAGGYQAITISLTDVYLYKKYQETNFALHLLDKSGILITPQSL